MSRLSPITRLVLLVSVNILAISLDKVRNLILLTLASLALWASTKPDMRKIRFTLMLVLPVMWSIVLMQGLFYRGEPKTVLLVIIPENLPVLGPLTGGVYLYYQGLIYGLVQSLRLVSAMLAGLAVAWSTTESELIRILSIGSRKLSIAVGVAIRSIDVISSELNVVMLNVKLTSRRGVSLKIRRIVRPLVAQVLRRSYVMSLALLSRGFNPESRSRVKLNLSLLDKVVIAVTLGFAVFIGIVKLLTMLFLYNLLYVPALDYLYRWALTSL